MWNGLNNTWTQGSEMMVERARSAGVVWDDQSVWITG